MKISKGILEGSSPFFVLHLLQSQKYDDTQLTKFQLNSGGGPEKMRPEDKKGVELPSMIPPVYFLSSVLWLQKSEFATKKYFHEL